MKSESQEINELYEDNENLRQRIHELESVIAHLVHESVHHELHGKVSGVHLTDKHITSDRIKNRQRYSNDFIQELGGPREFLKLFMGNPDNTD